MPFLAVSSSITYMSSFMKIGQVEIGDMLADIYIYIYIHTQRLYTHTHIQTRGDLSTSDPPNIESKLKSCRGKYFYKHLR
jgi:hypothetical protein